MEKAILVGVNTTDEMMKELESLCQTAGAEVLAYVTQNAGSINPATYIGSGKVIEIAEACKNMEADLLVFDNELTGSQIRNLEQATNVRVIDRTMLIIDIFGLRAHTKEGKVQVHLAQLKYMLPRLSGIGVSLSRQGGGATGGIGARRGAGETKLETDRRHIRQSINHLQKQLEEIKKNRHLIRSRRKKEGHPVIALVGYTNAGKSSLLNAITKSDVFVEDKLFATLDPTVRGIFIDNRKYLFVDTVGFIRNLPHHLVDAFKSTLEEVLFADILVHVADASNNEADQHIRAVNSILSELGAADKPTITVLNKSDLLPQYDVFDISNAVYLSAKTKKGIDKLLERIVGMVKK